MPSSSNNKRSKGTKKTTNKKTKKNRNMKEEKNVKKLKNKKKHPKLMLALKILLILFLLLCVIGAGVVAAMFFGLFGDEFEITKEELAVGASNTIVLTMENYFIS